MIHRPCLSPLGPRSSLRSAGARRCHIHSILIPLKSRSATPAGNTILSIFTQDAFFRTHRHRGQESFLPGQSLWSLVPRMVGQSHATWHFPKGLQTRLHVHGWTPSKFPVTPEESRVIPFVFARPNCSPHPCRLQPPPARLRIMTNMFHVAWPWVVSRECNFAKEL